tara:strand:- start:16 stop:288 length:273 start_codon:yes stop_codon:yes gene_type:complete
MKHNKINPFLVKKGFYISSMYFGHIPGDGYELISTDVVRGPFKTAERAFEILEKDYADATPMEYGVHGPEHRPNGYPTVWYNKNYEGEIV